MRADDLNCVFGAHFSVFCGAMYTADGHLLQRDFIFASVFTSIKRTGTARPYGFSIAVAMIHLGILHGALIIIVIIFSDMGDR